MGRRDEEEEREREAEKQILHSWLERNKAILCLGGTALLKAGSTIKGMPSEKSYAACNIQTSITKGFNKT